MQDLETTAINEFHQSLNNLYHTSQLLLPRSETENPKAVQFQLEIPGGKSNGKEISGKEFFSLWVYLERLSSEIQLGRQPILAGAL